MQVYINTLCLKEVYVVCIWIYAIFTISVILIYLFHIYIWIWLEKYDWNMG